MTTRMDVKPNQEYDNNSSLTQYLSIILSVAFVLSGAFLGYILYGAVKNTVATIDVPSLPYIDIALPSITNPQPLVGGEIRRGGEIPITGITGAPLPDYEKEERVNILLLGVDGRPDEEFDRTDTMILVTVDPENKTAGMLSVPRDLYIEIPGYYETRINQAHYYGEKHSHPGGGPALAMQTVQDVLDVPVHFYIKVDFDGFRQIVDTLGGIEIDVPKTIDDPTFPDNNYGFDPFYIDAGSQTLDGATALKYARTRHADNDFGRAERQQQVLIAIKDKALQLGVVTRIPDLWRTMAGTVETDLQMVDMIKLAELAQEIGAGDVTTLVLDESYTTNFTTDEGAMVLLPQWGKIQPEVQGMFAEIEGPSEEELERQRERERQQNLIEQQQEEQQELIDSLQAEGARVILQNGTDDPEMDAKTAEFLRKMGFDIVHHGPADLQDYPHTVIVDYTGKEYTLGTLANFFEVTQNNIRRPSHLESDIDIRVIIGADFELPATSELQPATSMVLQ